MFYPIITTLDGAGGQGRNKQKCYLPTGATTDLGGGRAGINKNVIHAGSQLTIEGLRAGISKNVTY